MRAFIDRLRSIDFIVVTDPKAVDRKPVSTFSHSGGSFTGWRAAMLSTVITPLSATFAIFASIRASSSTLSCSLGFLMSCSSSIDSIVPSVSSAADEMQTFSELELVVSSWECFPKWNSVRAQLNKGAEMQSKWTNHHLYRPSWNALSCINSMNRNWRNVCTNWTLFCLNGK